jgi:hypothetical protein
MTLNSRLALSGVILAAGFSPILAMHALAQEVGNLESECRSEAEYYGIPPEQLEEYIAGCVLSKGGAPAMPAVEESGIEEQTADDQLMEDQPPEEQMPEEQQLQEQAEPDELGPDELGIEQTDDAGTVEPQ